jgi:hypothetical protein
MDRCDSERSDTPGIAWFDTSCHLEDIRRNSGNDDLAAAGRFAAAAEEVARKSEAVVVGRTIEAVVVAQALEAAVARTIEAAVVARTLEAVVEVGTEVAAVDTEVAVVASSDFLYKRPTDTALDCNLTLATRRTSRTDEDAGKRRGMDQFGIGIDYTGMTGTARCAVQACNVDQFDTSPGDSTTWRNCIPISDAGNN